MRQLEAFANVTHVPIGYLFLPEPPEERLPIPDFRTVAGTDLLGPSPDLLDTVYAMQQRQRPAGYQAEQGEHGGLAKMGASPS